MDKGGLVSVYNERRNQKNLKPSMFNRIVHTEEGLTLYNSAHGIEGILRVSQESKSEVLEILSQRKITNDGEAIIDKLLKKGYLVPDNLDEKAFRNTLQMECLTKNQLHLVIHVTRACNFRCVYCYMDFEPVFLTEDTQQGIINYVRKNIHKYQGVRVSWFGGEPLLGVDIIEHVSQELIAICKLYHKPYTASMTTNGYGLTPEVLDRLTHCRLKNYTITIDGEKELHDRQRVLANGGPTFEQIISNLLYIKNNRKNCMFRISLRTNITIEHYDTLLRYYDYLYEKFGDDARFQFFTRRVSDYGGERVKAMEAKFLDSLTEVYKMLKKHNIKFPFYAHFSELEVGGYTCVAKQKNKYTIGCKGEISKCDEDICVAPIGKLHADGRMELDELSAAEWTGIKLKSDKCDDCFLSCCCLMEQCPLRRYNEEQVCRIDFEELDALIDFAGATIDAEII